VSALAQAVVDCVFVVCCGRYDAKMPTPAIASGQLARTRRAATIATRVLLLLIPYASLCPHIRTCNIGGHVDAINKTQNKNT
jgi:hypothetical protein